MNPTSSKSQNNRLRSERELRGWSQADLAEKVGTTQKIVSRWERGENAPGPYYRQKLCKLFGKNADELGLLDEQSQEDHSLIVSSRRDTGNNNLPIFDLSLADKLDSAETI